MLFFKNFSNAICVQLYGLGMWHTCKTLSDEFLNFANLIAILIADFELLDKSVVTIIFFIAV